MDHDDADAAPSVAADREWCFEAVRGVSRTFAITVDELREPMARRICVGYLLCRVPDTVEDATHVPPAEQAALLRTYSRALDPGDPTDVGAFRAAARPWIETAGDSDDWRVVDRAPRVVRAFESLSPRPREAMRPPIREMADGMATFVERYADDGGLRIETPAELEEYCGYVAGTVGRLVTDLLYGARSAPPPEGVHEDARAFALLLQLVNVAKDVAADYREENNVYVPALWLRSAGVAPDGVADPANADAVAGVIRRVTDRAAGYLDGAQSWIESMPLVEGNTLSAWGIPYLLAVATIRELRERPTDVVENGSLKIAREEVYAVVRSFDDDRPPEALGDLRRRVEAGPLHLE
jgi:farnesyl-diphosphate farnesyltransferase